jgi:hypothetical protein
VDWDLRFVENAGCCEEERRKTDAGDDGSGCTWVIDGQRATDNAESAKEEEEEPSQEPVATVSDEEVEDWDGEDCVDGAGSGREGVGHSVGHFRRNALLRSILTEE